MPAFIDLTGRKFGRLLVQSINPVIRQEPNGRRVRSWNCLCECGADLSVLGGNLRTGNTISCGCFRKEVTSSTYLKHGNSAGGPNPTPEYEVWKGMLARCSNPSHKSFHRYGGRGIRVCDEWASSFDAFLAYMGCRPSPELTVERIENDGNYEPGNVKWATRKEQRANTGSSI